MFNDIFEKLKKYIFSLKEKLWARITFIVFFCIITFIYFIYRGFPAEEIFFLLSKQIEDNYKIIIKAERVNFAPVISFNGSGFEIGTQAGSKILTLDKFKIKISPLTIFRKNKKISISGKYKKGSLKTTFYNGDNFKFRIQTDVFPMDSSLKGFIPLDFSALISMNGEIDGNKNEVSKITGEILIEMKDVNISNILLSGDLMLDKIAIGKINGKIIVRNGVMNIEGMDISDGDVSGRMTGEIRLFQQNLSLSRLRLDINIRLNDELKERIRQKMPFIGTQLDEKTSIQLVIGGTIFEPKILKF